MSTTIHKFVVEAPEAMLRMDETATIVRVEPHPESARHLVFWAIVNPEGIVGERRFLVTGTGNPVPDGVRYVGTAVGHVFTWHLWEVAA